MRRSLEGTHHSDLRLMPLHLVDTQIAFLAIAALSGGLSAQSPCDNTRLRHLVPTVEALDSLRSLDPVQSAEAAFAGGEFRPWSLLGQQRYVPIASAPEPLEVRDGDTRTRHMPFTGHMLVRCTGRDSTGQLVVDSTHVLWQQVSLRFAAIYNRRLLDLLEADGRAF